MVERAEEGFLRIAGAQVAEQLKVRNRRRVEEHDCVHDGNGERRKGDDSMSSTKVGGGHVWMSARAGTGPRQSARTAVYWNDLECERALDE